MKLKNVFLAALLPVAVLSACGGTASDASKNDDPPGSSSTGKTSVCADYCDKLAECDDIEIEECTSSCEDNETTSLAGQTAINECFNADVCELDETAGAAALICLVTELDDLELSGAAQTYCSESVDAINSCLMAEPDPEALLGDCEDTIGVASDELLEGLNACAERDCEDVQSCVELEVFKAALPLIELLSGLEEGAEPSPALVAELLALGVVFGQLGLDDGGELDDLLAGMTPTDPPAMGGSAGQ